MTNLPWMAEGDAHELRTVGRLAYLEARLQQGEQELAQAPDWGPARALTQQLAWVRARLASLGEAWGRRLVVALVGPSGAGKSTLLNALAGAELSPTGLERPTTRQVIAFASDTVAVAPLLQALGQEQVRLVSSPRAARLQYLTLLDTPDTNTLPENQALLARTLEQADVILTVFAAANPRLQDNLAFLRPFVRALPVENVIPVLNQVDRVPPGELAAVRASFQQAMRADWGLAPERVYLISARSSAPASRALEDERPLQGLNQFAELEQFVLARLNQAQAVADRRLGRAERLCALWEEEVAAALGEAADARRRATGLLDEIAARTRQAITQTLAAQTLPGEGLGLQRRLYALLAERWWGPVGWLVGVWALALRIAAAVRGAAPWRLGSAQHEAEELSPAWASIEGGWRAALARLYAAAWPPVADALVAAGLAPALRAQESWAGSLEATAHELRVQAQALLQAQVQRTARVLAAWPWQVLLNAPVLAVMGWSAVSAVSALWRSVALPPDYLRTVAVALLAVWLLAFVLLQGAVALVSRWAARRSVARELGALYVATPLAGWQGQLAALDRLATWCADHRRDA